MMLCKKTIHQEQWRVTNSKRQRKVTNWTLLQQTLKLMRNSNTSQEDDDNDNDTLIEDGSDMCQTSGTESVRVET